MSNSILQIISSCSVQKTNRKKHQIFEKWEHFENRPSCKGYSPCKILTFGQKIKFQKTCQIPFYKSFRVDLCKKPVLEKTKKIPELRAFWKSAIMQRHACINFTLSQKLKFQKTCQNPNYKSLTVNPCKKLLVKATNIREMRAFSKSAIMQRL